MRHIDSSSFQSYNKKRTRDSDLMQPLQEDRDEVPESLEFHPITDPEVCFPVLYASSVGVAHGGSPWRSPGRYWTSELDPTDPADDQKLIPVSITTNRAPVKTAWAYTVAVRMGFDTQEALSIAHVYVHLSSMRHALKLGNIYNKEETREAEDELADLPGADVRVAAKPEKWGRRGRGKEEEKRNVIGSSQPWVGILRAK